MAEAKGHRHGSRTRKRETDLIVRRDTKMVGNFSYLSPTWIVGADVAVEVFLRSITAIKECLAQMGSSRGTQGDGGEAAFGEIRGSNAAYALDRSGKLSST
jgi:hypothetical protein